MHDKKKRNKSASNGELERVSLTRSIEIFVHDYLIVVQINDERLPP